MATKFRPRVSKARFVYSPFSPQQMLGFGDELAASIKVRMLRGETIYDTPAPPLSERYARYKLRRTGSNIRDMKFTGRTMRALRPLRANENRVTIGFSDPVVQLRVSMNQRRSRQFGISPRDKSSIVRVIKLARTVHVQSRIA